MGYILLNNNFDLYKSDPTSCEKSLNYAKTMDKSKVINKNLIFHCLWRVPREFGMKQAAVIRSIIVNHYDNLNNLEINLWSNVDLSENSSLDDVKEYIKFRRWDFDEEKIGTPLENVGYLNNKTLFDTKCYIEGDFFRILVLYKYGGFYIDMDVLILRNMMPLNDYEFLYQWGSSGNGKEDFAMNGAIMRLNKNSPLANEMLNLLVKQNLIENTVCCGKSLYSLIKQNHVLALPCVWFNSEWIDHRIPLKPFENIGTIELFDGAYTWHWHNRWDQNVEPGSKFDYLETLNISKLVELKQYHPILTIHA